MNKKIELFISMGLLVLLGVFILYPLLIKEKDHPTDIHLQGSGQQGIIPGHITVPSLTGDWDMTANVNFKFQLKLVQDGDKIQGQMSRTNGTEPIDSVRGKIHDDGTVDFLRSRVNQAYHGQLTTDLGGQQTLKGTFDNSSEWIATKTVPGTLIRP